MPCHSLEGLRARSNVPAHIHARALRPRQGLRFAQGTLTAGTSGPGSLRWPRRWPCPRHRAAGWPPSWGDRGLKSHRRSWGQLQGQHRVVWVPSWGPWDLLQLPEGAVAPQGTGDGRAPLLADGVLPEAGERHGAGSSSQGRAGPAAPPGVSAPPALGLRPPAQ